MVDYTSAMNSTGVLVALSKHKTAQVQRKKNDNRIGICRRGSPHSEWGFSFGHRSTISTKEDVEKDERLT